MEFFKNDKNIHGVTKQIVFSTKKDKL